MRVVGELWMRMLKSKLKNRRKNRKSSFHPETNAGLEVMWIQSMRGTLSMITHTQRGQMWHVRPNGIRALLYVRMSIVTSEGRTLYIFLILEILLLIVAGLTARLPVCNVTINH